MGTKDYFMYIVDEIHTVIAETVDIEGFPVSSY